VSDPEPPLLRIHQATVFRGGARVLDGLSLTLRAGEHCAILGPNGSGKSSLIRLLAHLDHPLHPADGTPPITIFGKERWDVFELRAQLGIVSQGLQGSILDGAPGTTRGLEAVLSGFFAAHGIFRHHEVSAGMQERARRALALVEASHLAERFIETMSDGEIKRVLIARALVPDPRALLLDEPTANLDLVARERFLGSIRSLAARGKTIILVTHHAEEIIPEIERVVLLGRGRVLFDGPKREVLSSANLSAIFQAPVKVEESAGYYLATVDRTA
jgi:iron complex transport system ATP-binding protein